jgi:hypothetical protein
MCDGTEIRVVAPRLLLDAIPDLKAAADSVNTSEIERNEHGEITIGIDECIVPAVKALWDAGIVTLSSCCGHVQPGDDHPWGVITIQTKPGVAQRGAVLLRRERYDALEADLAAARAELDKAAAGREDRAHDRLESRRDLGARHAER